MPVVINGTTGINTDGQGNLTFSGTGQRIVGDMSNATVANRIAFQSSTTNGATSISLIPNGTAIVSGVNCYGTPDPANANAAQFAVINGLETRIQATANGTASAIPMTFYTSGSERMRLDTSGNLGLGVTPSAWSIRALQIGSGFAAISTGVTNARIFGNTYYDNAYRYVGTGRATQYEQDGYHAWYVSASGTAGNAISFTQAMTLDASGNLGVGSTSPSHRLDLAGAVGASSTFGLQVHDTGANLRVQLLRTGASYNYAGVGANESWLYSQGSSNLSLGPDGAGAVKFVTNGSERARIDASGQMTIGATGNYASLLTVRGSIKRLVAVNGTSGSPAEEAGLIYDDGAVNRTGIYFFNNFLSASDSWMSFKTMAGAVTAERMRLDASGNLLVGTTSGTFSQIVSGNGYAFGVSNSTTNNNVLLLAGTSGSTAQNKIVFANGGSVVGTVYTTGSATSYNTSSDYRLKENIQPMTGALAKVQALKPVTYTWKADGSDGEGFIAHELAEVVPQCVTGEKDAVDEEGKPVYQGIDTSFLVATLTAAIQELKAELDTVKTELAALKGTA